MGLWIARGQKTTTKYFIADRRIPAWAVAFTLMAAMVSSGTVVGHPATVYKDHMMLLLGNASLPIVLIFVAIFIVPFYRNVVRMSAYEYLGSRFGFGARIYASLGFVADRTFDLGVTLLTTAIAVKVMTGWPMVGVIVGIGLFTTLYTTIGGIEGVVWTNAVQGIILLGGTVLILGVLLFAPEAGPPGAVVLEAYRGGKFNLGSFELSWKSLFDTAATTQWLFIFAYLINWGRRYITDQHMVQRYLIAKTDREARKGALWGAISCVPIFVIFMLIGAFLWGYYSLTNNAPAEIADHIVPHFLVNTLPMGLVGLILAAIMAASMSSVSADLNSIASVLTTDYFATFLPRTSDRARLWFGRLMALVGGSFATWIAVMLIPEKGLASLMERAVTIAAILSGGMLGLFFLGFLTRCATRLGCYIGIVFCLVFTGWGILTTGTPEDKIVDMGFNFEMNPILIGVLGHFVLFGVGYAASLFFPAEKPAKALTIYGWLEKRKERAA
jgi:SSS family solute:Na+ symporter